MAEKKVVVDEKSATIREVQEGQVVRFWPYRAISDGSVVVGPAYLVDSDGATQVTDGRIRVFDDPPDRRGWMEDGGRHRDNGWSMKPSNHPTFFGPLIAKPLCWKSLGPKQVIAQELEKLRKQLKEFKAAIRKTRKPATKQELQLQVEGVLARIKDVELRERSRRAQARQEWERTKGRPSRRKKQIKMENAPESEGDKQQKKGKKKGKGKKKSSGGGEEGQKKSKGKNKGGKGRRGEK